MGDKLRMVIQLLFVVIDISVSGNLFAVLLFF